MSKQTSKTQQIEEDNAASSSYCSTLLKPAFSSNAYSILDYYRSPIDICSEKCQQQQKTFDTHKKELLEGQQQSPYFLFVGFYHNNIISKMLFVWTFLALGFILAFTFLTQLFPSGDAYPDHFPSPWNIISFVCVLLLNFPDRRSLLLKILFSAVGFIPVLISTSVMLSFLFEGREIKVLVNDNFTVSSETPFFSRKQVFDPIAGTIIFILIVELVLIIRAIYFLFFSKSRNHMASQAVDCFQYATSIASFKSPFNTIAEWKLASCKTFSPDAIFSSTFKVIRVFSRLFDLPPRFQLPSILSYDLPALCVSTAPGVNSPQLPLLLIAGAAVTIGACLPVHISFTVLFINVSKNFAYVVIAQMLPCISMYLAPLMITPFFAFNAQRELRKGLLFTKRGDSIFVDSYAFQRLKKFSSIADATSYPITSAISCLFTITLTMFIGVSISRLKYEVFVEYIVLIVVSEVGFVVMIIVFGGLVARRTILTSPTLATLVSPVLIAYSAFTAIGASFFRLLFGSLSVLLFSPFSFITTTPMLPRLDAVYCSFWSVLAVDNAVNNPVLLNAVAILLAKSELKKQCFGNNNYNNNNSLTFSSVFSSLFFFLSPTSEQNENLEQTMEEEDDNDGGSNNNNNNTNITFTPVENSNSIVDDDDDDDNEVSTATATAASASSASSSKRRKSKEIINERNNLVKLVSVDEIGKEQLSDHPILRSLVWLHILRARKQIDRNCENKTTTTTNDCNNDNNNNKEEEEEKVDENVDEEEEEREEETLSDGNFKKLVKTSVKFPSFKEIPSFYLQSSAATFFPFLSLFVTDKKKEVAILQEIEMENVSAKTNLEIAVGEHISQFKVKPVEILKQMSTTKTRRRFWLFYYLSKFPFLQKERKHFLWKHSYAKHPSEMFVEMSDSSPDDVDAVASIVASASTSIEPME